MAFPKGYIQSTYEQAVLNHYEYKWSIEKIKFTNAQSESAIDVPLPRVHIEDVLQVTLRWNT